MSKIMTKKFKMIVVLTENNKLVQCIKTFEPLIGYPEHREKLQTLLDVMSAECPDTYGKCRIATLVEKVNAGWLFWWRR